MVLRRVVSRWCVTQIKVRPATMTSCLKWHPVSNTLVNGSTFHSVCARWRNELKPYPPVAGVKINAVSFSSAYDNMGAPLVIKT